MDFETFRMYLDVFADATVPIVGLFAIFYLRRFVNNVKITFRRAERDRRLAR
jgi:hypothetical protein